MDKNSEAFAALGDACASIISSNVVMLPKKIKALLKCVAYYEVFREAVGQAQESFNFGEAEKAALRGGSYKLPALNRDRVALTLAILLEMDLGKRDIIEFLQGAFPSEDISVSLKNFYYEMIEPFRQALIDLTMTAEKKEEQSYLDTERAIEFASAGLNYQAAGYLISIKEAVNLKTSDEERPYFLIMVDGLSAALDSKDTLMIRAIWAGLKLALKSEKICKEEILAIDELLRLYIVNK